MSLFQLWLDSCAAPCLSPTPKEEDFFATHASAEVRIMLYGISQCASSDSYKGKIFRMFQAKLL